jgi:hypothetical protein
MWHPRVSGYLMPRLGFGVYANYTTKISVLECFGAGYRFIFLLSFYLLSVLYAAGMLIRLRHIETRVMWERQFAKVVYRGKIFS